MLIVGKAARRAAFFISLSALACPQAWSQNAPSGVEIAPGSGSFAFVDAKGDASKTMTVYTYLPKNIPAQSARIVFVMHGFSKDATGARDIWIEHADRHGLLVIAPLFDREQWGRGGYSYASIFAPGGKPQDPSLWSFSVIEHLFDAIKASTGNSSPRYLLYGHSEGGQFVQRLVLLLPDARYSRAVSANAGWYMMPSFEAKYPYGLAGSPATRDSLAKSLARDFVILLGELDSDPNHFQLRRTPEAMAQGPHRFARGESFFREGRKHAEELGGAFGWRTRPVPGAAHENDKMSRPAATILMEP